MDGSHGISEQVRADCTGEVAMSLALGAGLQATTRGAASPPTCSTCSTSSPSRAGDHALTLRIRLTA